MTKKVFAMGMMIVMAFLIDPALAGPKVTPGKWEITTKTTMSGMKHAQSQTHVQCITEKDMVPMSDDASQECRIEDMKVQGNTVSWKIYCGGHGGGMEGTGHVTYTGDTMQGIMEMTMSGSPMQVKNEISGRRIGDCDQVSSGTSSSKNATKRDGALSTGAAEDAKDVGQAARDEAKQSTIDEVQGGVKGLFKGLFK
jgi:hypothetical protein